MAQVNRKEYLIIFVVLAVLTIVEVFLPEIKSLGRTAIIGSLIALAIAKAGIVALFYMHLKHETRGLKYIIGIPLAVPGFYALILIFEGAWRILST